MTSPAAAPPIFDAWKPESPGLIQLAAKLSTEAGKAIEASDWPVPGQHFPEEVGLPKVAGVPCVSCVEVGPHIDETNSPWFVMLVLRSNGHVLHAADLDAVPKGEELARLKPEMSVPLKAGDAVILPSMKVHWLSGSPGAPAPRDWASQDECEALLAEDPKGDQLYELVASRLRPHHFVAASYEVETRPSKEQAEALLLERCDRAAVFSARAGDEPAEEPDRPFGSPGR